jgi:LPS-assembly lipoprotein
MWSYDMIRILNTGLLVIIIGLLSGCGFTPVYSGTSGDKVKHDLSSIGVEPIKDRIGQRLRNHLIDIINPAGRPAKPVYSLSIDLRESKQTLAVQKTEIATRANLRFTARFGLARRGQSGALLTGQSTSITSYNILTSEFATLAAERNARDRAARELSIEIANQLAIFLQPTGTAAP